MISFGFFACIHLRFIFLCKFRQKQPWDEMELTQNQTVPYHIWSIATCYVLKNEGLYLKHERRVCFSPLFILVDFPRGIIMPVSVDTLIEMCEVKTIVYINACDLCSTIIGLSPYTPGIIQVLNWRAASYNAMLRGFNPDKQHHRMRYHSKNCHLQISLLRNRRSVEACHGPCEED